LKENKNVRFELMVVGAKVVLLCEAIERH